ncbi:MAG: YHS domain-containing protein [Candidatus Thermoplasmatota archaeon]|nr:YHS domain-containing protein [Candidatus Thermoplasmatota archaeon]
MPVDPICGMKVEETSKYRSKFQGKDFYFCCMECKETFDRNPLKYSR